MVRSAALALSVVTLLLADDALRGADKDKRPDLHGDALPAGAVARMGSVRLRHTKADIWAAFSADGKALASSSADGTLRVWDVATGREVRRWHDEQCRFGRPITFLADGKVLLSADWRAIQLLDVTTGKTVRRIEAGEPHQIMDVTVSPDGKRVAAETRRAIAVWDLATGQMLNKYAAKGTYVLFARDGTLLEIAGTELWDVAAEQRVLALDVGPDAPIKWMIVSPDGKTVATVQPDDNVPDQPWRHVVRFWDGKTGKELPQFKGQQLVALGELFSPEGKAMALGLPDGAIRLVDLASGKEVRRWEVRQGPAIPTVFSPDGKLLASVAAGNRIVIHDVATGKLLQPSGDDEDMISAVAWAPDGKALACGTLDAIRLRDPATGKALRRLEGHTKRVRSLAYSPDGRVLASAADDGTSRLWDPATGRQTHVFKDRGAGVAFSRDGKFFASGAAPICLRETATGKEVRSMGRTYASTCLALSPDGRLLASGSVVLESFLFEAATGKEIGARDSETGLIDKVERSYRPGTSDSLSFSPDGRVLAAATRGPSGFTPSGLVHLVLLNPVPCRTHEPLGRELSEPPPAADCLAFSPDGKLLALGAKDGAVRLWDLAAGKERHTFAPSAGAVRAVAFAPDGKSLASVHEDGSAFVWDVAGALRDHPWPAPKLTEKDLGALWKGLANNYDLYTYQAMCALAAAPDKAVPFLARRLRSVSLPGPKEIAALIADLDSESFAKREKATKALTELGELAGPALRKAQAGPSAEVRRRAEAIFNALKEKGDEWTAPADLFSACRAVEVLEMIGTRDARGVLEGLAKGEADAALTTAATAALKRLEQRPDAP
jgi:WD40 repeat protein